MSLAIIPPIPPFDGLHPLIVHAPVVLLALAPLFVALALVLRPQRQVLAWIALGFCLAGTVGAFAAVQTGEAAEDQVEQQAPAAEAVLEQHESLAKTTMITFGVISLVFAVALVAPLALRKPLPARLQAGALALLLVALLGGVLLLANAAHEGARLVHEFGVGAWKKSASPPPAAPARHDDD